MATKKDLERLKQEIIESRNDDLRRQNEEFKSEILDIKQRLNINNSQDLNDEDNMDIIINSHMKDIESDNRLTRSISGLQTNKKHFRDLNNHELHQIKNIYERDHKIKPKTILDENLGDIMDKCINFITYSFDGYHTKYYEAETIIDVYDNDKTFFDIIKTHMITIILFIRDDQNIIYIGILLVFLSIIIYLINIITS